MTLDLQTIRQGRATHGIRRVLTPEGVEVEFALAGRFQRLLAMLIDFGIQILLSIGLWALVLVLWGVLLQRGTNLESFLTIVLLIGTFFLQFFPDLIRQGHLYILQTPLFRVRTKKETRYCYSDNEKDAAVESMGKGVEITRFKGLGEASPDEFATFIGPDIKLEPVTISHLHNVNDLLSFYMGKNTQDRQEFIINNLKVELDLAELDG